MKKYEIYNLTTGELLANNLNFDDMPELFGAYMEFYPEDDIVVCCRETKITVTHARVVDNDEVNRREFRSEWLAFMDEIVAIGNFSDKYFY